MSNTEDTGSPKVPGEPGPDSSIPNSDTGIAVGYTGEPSTLEPEEENDVPNDDKTIES
ncbi:hypothetical protein IWX78_002402 [Mycetocola sp. CAN_C7]|uniref:hypothetical protein n=1 Tax=Mycetocola sp. CAN_C7 TaxID=2787724 RepID=UPI0018C9FF29